MEDLRLQIRLKASDPEERKIIELFKNQINKNSYVKQLLYEITIGQSSKVITNEIIESKRIQEPTRSIEDSTKTVQLDNDIMSLFN